MFAPVEKPSSLKMEVLQQFRVIYGSMRRHFREIEHLCGLPGAQLWLLQEVSVRSGIGVSDLAERMGIHQSTCSQLIERLVKKGYLYKIRDLEDHRRVGLRLSVQGEETVRQIPDRVEGILPAALAEMPEVALKTLHINLSELLRHLPERQDYFATIPLSNMIESPSAESNVGQTPVSRNVASA